MRVGERGEVGDFAGVDDQGDDGERGVGEGGVGGNFEGRGTWTGERDFVREGGGDWVIGFTFVGVDGVLGVG